jgi:spermidine/putrescine transport system permease protein
VTLFLLLPMLGIAAISFLRRGTYGQLEWTFTLENFKRFAGFGTFGYDPVYLQVIGRSLGLAAGTSLFCALAAVPLAFFVARLPSRWKQLALMLVVIPFWTNLLIRTYAWQILLSGTSWLARAAATVGWSEPGTALFPSMFAVFVGLTCDYLPFLVLPLYASVEKLDWTLAEAASDLGANPWQVFWHAVLPQVRPGLVAGTILVFVPATGQFIIPDLLGGAKTALLGNAIQQQFGPSRDWPFGSAIACLAMALVLLGLWLYARTTDREGEALL